MQTTLRSLHKLGDACKKMGEEKNGGPMQHKESADNQPQQQIGKLLNNGISAVKEHLKNAQQQPAETNIQGVA